jgi:hypothetical protein
VPPSLIPPSTAPVPRSLLHPSIDSPDRQLHLVNRLQSIPTPACCPGHPPAHLVDRLECCPSIRTTAIPATRLRTSSIACLITSMHVMTVVATRGMPCTEGEGTELAGSDQVGSRRDQGRASLFLNTVRTSTPPHTKCTHGAPPLTHTTLLPLRTLRSSP